MKCQRLDNWLTLEFAEQEKELLLFSLEEVEDHYAQDESALGNKFKAYWRGRLSQITQNEQELGEANEDLYEARWAWKSARLDVVRKWLAEEGSLKSEGSSVLVLDESEAEQFLSILNDRRLLLALEHNLDEDLMARNPTDVTQPELQQSLWEIHFLAIVQQYVLEALT
jgi:hypothetical protein